MFLTLPESMHGDIVAYLATQLQEMMNLCRSLEEMNSAIVTINCCFDNFPIGVQAVGHCFLPTLQLVETCLSSCIAELCVKLSPARRMEVCQMVHGALRAAVAVLQKYQPNIRQLLQSKVGLKEDQSLSITIHSLTGLLSLDKQSTQPSEEDVCAKVSCPGVDNLTSLLELVCALMSYADLPLDTHTNCGMVLIFLRILLQGTSSKTIKKLEMPWRVDLSTDVCQLSIYCGMLNVLSASELGCLHPDTGTPVIHFIFRQLYEIGQRSTADSGMVLVVSRALLLLSRNLLNIGSVTVVEGILLEMLQFMWIHLEHYMDSVRHSAAGILHNLVKLGALLQNEGSNGCGVITTIMKEVVQIPAQKKSKYIGLAAVADEIGCQVLIDQMPHLVKDLLKALADPNLTSHVSSAVERLMLQHAGEVRDAALWRDMWVTPVLDMLAWVPPCQCGPLQAILATAVSRVPGLASHILPSSPTSTHLRTLLACFRLARRQGALDGPSRPGMWKGVVELEILEQALYHQDSEIRVSALSLLAVSHRSTEAFSPCELQLIKTYLVYNVNTEDPSSRQQTLALMKKVLTRLHGSSQVLFRKIEQGKAKKKELETDSNEAHLLKSYNTFLLWLLDFCFINLFPGANFGRRGSSLQVTYPDLH
ncbi:hypothetical protein ANN_12347 [Periplaneta americana]|uniref:tRNA (32-2'-O)-methyltransferase regulator THADA-like TPR repeats region domain-containing protein n=1 Tax=Periplaneta americana TaxID=6978 RepID=A0ABQ8TG93_PERAM|nr:hypothetical protein ANN_12347 [Periplaneta americana]